MSTRSNTTQFPGTAAASGDAAAVPPAEDRLKWMFWLGIGFVVALLLEVLAIGAALIVRLAS